MIKVWQTPCQARLPSSGGCVLQGRSGKAALAGLFYQDTHESAFLWPSHLPEPSPPNSLTLGIMFQRMDLGDTLSLCCSIPSEETAAHRTPVWWHTEQKTCIRKAPREL